MLSKPEARFGRVADLQHFYNKLELFDQRYFKLITFNVLPLHRYSNIGYLINYDI